MSKTICYCKEIDKKTIKKAIENGAHSLKEIKKITGAGTGGKCKKLHPKERSCVKDLKKILEKQIKD